MRQWNLLLLILYPSENFGEFLSGFQPTGEFQIQYLKYKDTFDWVAPAYSVCFRFQLQFQRGKKNYLFSYSLPETPEKMNFFLSHTEKKGSFCIGEFCSEVNYNDDQIRDNLNTVCGLVFGLKTNITTVRLFFAGDWVDSDSFTTVEDEEKNKGIVMLGQEQDKYGGGIDIKQSFSGQITQFNIWDRKLTDEEVNDFHNCESNPKGSLVSWERGNWNIKGDITFEEMELPELCRIKLTSLVKTIPDPVDFKTAAKLCQFISGTVQSAGFGKDPNLIYQEFKEELGLQDTECVDADGDISYWLGNFYDDGVWVNYLNSTHKASNMERVRVPKTPEETCLVNAYGRIRPRLCNRLHCAVCRLTKKTHDINLLGVCDEETMVKENFDTLYVPSGIRNRRMYIRGVGSSHIYYEPGESDSSEGRTGQWVLQSFKDPRLLFRLHKKFSNSLPFGRLTWEVGPYPFCDLQPGTEVDLTLSDCPDETFTCNDAECIPLAKKCDQRIDCKDRSDESNCNYLQVPSRYSGDQGPRSTSREPIPIYLNISILAYPVINTIGLQFTVDFYINLRWYDGRLSFKDLNAQTMLNSVPTSALQRLWTPELDFLNALGPSGSVVDSMSVCTIVMEQDPTYVDMAESWEYYGFKGSDNAINLNREYYQAFACEFDLYYYPFDTQVCEMEFSIQGYTKDFMTFVKDHAGIEYLGKRDLLEYQIQEEELYVSNRKEESRAEVKIVFRRRIEYHLFGVFLQQKILVIIGFLTFFFDVTNFTDRVMTSLTLMLVVATVSSSIQSTLPATPYLKMIDIWMFVSLNLMVFSLIFHTMLLYRVHKENKETEARRGSSSATATTQVSVNPMKSRPTSPFSRFVRVGDESAQDEELPKSRRFNAKGKWVYAGTTLLFWFVFWIIAIVEFYREPDAYIKEDLVEDLSE